MFFAIPSGRFGTKVENLSFSRLKVISVAKLVGLCKTNQRYNAIYQTKLYNTWDSIKISSLFLSNGFVGILPILDEEINKLETEVRETGCAKKLSTMGQGLASPTTALEEVVTLLPWMRPHLTKQGSVPYKEKRDALTDQGWLRGACGPG